MNLYSANFSWRLRSNRFVSPLNCFTFPHSLPGTLCAGLWNCPHKSQQCSPGVGPWTQASAKHTAGNQEGQEGWWMFQCDIREKRTGFRGSIRWDVSELISHQHIIITSCAGFCLGHMWCHSPRIQWVCGPHPKHCAVLLGLQFQFVPEVKCYRSAVR